MDARWWVWIGLALFAGVLTYTFLSAPSSAKLEPTVLSLESISENRVTLARTHAGKLEYRRVPHKLTAYFHEKSHEFSYILRGRAAGFIKDQSITVEPQYFLIIPRKTALGLRTASTEPLEILSFYAPAPDGLDEVQALIGDIFPLGDPSSLSPPPLPTYESELRPALVNLANIAQLPHQGPGREWGYLARSPVGSAVLMRTTARVHLSERSLHFLYIRQGHARITVEENTWEAMTGQAIVLPNGVQRAIESVGSEPLEFLLFSAPGLRERDIN